VDAQKKAWEKANPPSVEMKFIKSEFLMNNPKFTSMKQIKAEEK